MLDEQNVDYILRLSYSYAYYSYEIQFEDDDFNEEIYDFVAYFFQNYVSNCILKLHL